MTAGVYAIDRGVWQHEAFADEPYTEREAWLWLLGAAAWKAQTVRIGKFVATVKRGDYAASIRFLAEKWQWDKARVSRFLTRLKKLDMIETQTETGITVITIRNYNEYQRVSLPKRDTDETRTETGARQQRDKEEYTQDIQTEIDSPTPAPSLISAEANEASEAIRSATGMDFDCPAYVGLGYLVQTAMNEGIPREFVVEKITAIGPRKPPAYYAKAIRNSWIERQTSPPPPTARHGPQQRKQNPLMDAIDDHIRTFQRQGDGSSETRESPHRLLSNG